MSTAIPSDTKCFQPLLKPTNDIDPAGGGISVTQITNAVVGEIFPQLAGLPSGDLDVDIKFQTQKMFIKLDSTGTQPDGSVSGLKAYGKNWLATPPSTGFMTLEPSSSADDSTKTVQAWFQGAGATLPTPENIILNGVTPVSGIQAMVKAFRLKLVDTATGLIPQTADEDIVVKIDGTVVGIIPAGYTWASGEFRMAIEPTYNSTSQVPTRISDVATLLGISFSVPINEATGLAFGSGAAIPGQIDAQDAQGIWIEFVLQPGMPVEPEVEFGIRWSGGAAL